MPPDPLVRLGTSAFTASGWLGTFYPEGRKAADYLTYYAQHFDTVEVDSTFYHAPSISTVRGWYAKTPKDFLLAAKVPQTITHEKMLVDCDDDLSNFLKTMDTMGEKLGPLLFQLPYFNQKAFRDVGEFLARLRPFLKKLPNGYRFAVEIRNKNWLDARFAETLREHNVALALIDQAWMPPIGEVMEKFDPITADFTYIRWLGDRKGIEEQTKTWDKVIVDRQRELDEWVEACRNFNQRNIAIFGFANNHYAGHAPATVRLFWELWQKKSPGAERSN